MAVEDDSSDVPGLREPLTSAGPPGVMELMMVPRSERPESSPPTTWKPRQHKQTFTHIVYFRGIGNTKIDKIDRKRERTVCTSLPRPYLASFFRFTVVISLSGDGKALSFFLNESVQHRNTIQFYSILYLFKYNLCKYCDRWKH